LLELVELLFEVVLVLAPQLASLDFAGRRLLRVRGAADNLIDLLTNHGEVNLGIAANVDLNSSIVADLESSNHERPTGKCGAAGETEAPKAGVQTGER
jgi:hypothetical protein